MSLRSFCSRKAIVFVVTGFWALSLLILTLTQYFLQEGAQFVPARLSAAISPRIPTSCGDHARSYLVVSVTTADDLSQTFKTVDSVLTSAVHDDRLRITVHIPYRLRRQKSQIQSYYNDLITSGLVSLYINPLEPEQPPSHSYVNTTWLHRQRTLDFSYAAQVGADRSHFFLPLAAGHLTSSAHLVDDLIRAINDASTARWSTLDFLPDQYAFAPAFSGRLFNSTDLMRIALGLRTYRAARPAEQLLSTMASSVLAESQTFSFVHWNLFTSTGETRIYQEQAGDAVSDLDDELKESSWSCLPQLPARNASSLLQYQYRFAFAIPTSFRPSGVSFITPLLGQLFSQIEKAEPLSVVIVMFMTGGEWEQQIRQDLRAQFGPYIRSQQLRLLSAPVEEYPTLDGLRENYGDSPGRVRWRSKQNIDYASLIAASRGLADYYVMMEDDVELLDNFVAESKNVVEEQSRSHNDWAMIDVCKDIGFAGKVFHDHTMFGLEILLRAFYDELPCDWTLLAAIGLESGYMYQLPDVLLKHKGKGISTLTEKNVPDPE